MSFRIAFFDTKPYDEDSFSKMNERFGFDIVYFKGHLNPNNVMLTQGFDAVCIFVNDIADAGVIDTLVKNGVKLLALRCAGYNNVDLAARGAFAGSQGSGLFSLCRCRIYVGIDACAQSPHSACYVAYPRRKFFIAWSYGV